jgi:hypothetical protein
MPAAARFGDCFQSPLYAVPATLRRKGSRMIGSMTSATSSWLPTESRLACGDHASPALRSAVRWKLASSSHTGRIEPKITKNTIINKFGKIMTAGSSPSDWRRTTICDLALVHGPPVPWESCEPSHCEHELDADQYPLTLSA